MSLGYVTGEGGGSLVEGEVEIEPVPLREMIVHWQARSDSILRSAEMQAQNMLAMQRRSVGLTPGDPRAHFALGDTFFRLKQYADAEAAFTTVTELSPDDVGAWLRLAESRGAQRNWDGFETALAEAESREPDRFEIPLYRGRRLLAGGDPANALEAFAEAQSRAGSDAQRRTVAGWIQRAQQRR